MMKKLSDTIATIFVKNHIIIEEEADLYKYGCQIALEMVVCCLTSLFVAAGLGMVPECLMFYSVFIPLRSYFEGIHMKSFLGCYLLSNLVIIGILITVKYADLGWIISVLLSIFSLCFFIVIVVKRDKMHAEEKYFQKREMIILLLIILEVLFCIVLKQSSFLSVVALTEVVSIISSILSEKIICKQSVNKVITEKSNI